MSSKTLTTSAVLEIQSVVEIHSKPDGRVWYGIAEAQTDDHLRVKMCADGSELPAWDEGAPVQCVMEGNDGRYHTEAIVLKQSREVVWFHLPPLSTRIDRRKTTRVTGGMPVTYKTEDSDGIAVCLNISAQGMRMRLPAEVEERTQLELYFILPGETLPIRTRAVVTHIAKPEPGRTAVDAGVRFMSPAPADVSRIARFCRM